jgi:hypothetical protein
MRAFGLLTGDLHAPLPVLGHGLVQDKVSFFSQTRRNDSVVASTGPLGSLRPSLAPPEV